MKNLPNLPSRLYGRLAQVGQALASPQRIQILNLLCQSARSVDELAEELGQSAANTSAHLKVLRESHLIEIRREGRRAICSLVGDSAIKLWLALRDFGLAELPEVREMMRSYDLEDAPPERAFDGELMEMVRAGSAILLDVRPANEYEAGHLPLAQSLPADELEARLGELPRDRTIFVYRRGPFCTGSVKAVQLLNKAGFRARRLLEGVAEWRAAGKRLEGRKS